MRRRKWGRGGGSGRRKNWFEVEPFSSLRLLPPLAVFKVGIFRSSFATTLPAIVFQQLVSKIVEMIFKHEIL